MKYSIYLAIFIGVGALSGIISGELFGTLSLANFPFHFIILACFLVPTFMLKHRSDRRKKLLDGLR